MNQLWKFIYLGPLDLFLTLRNTITLRPYVSFIPDFLDVTCYENWLETKAIKFFLSVLDFEQRCSSLQIVAGLSERLSKHRNLRRATLLSLSEHNWWKSKQENEKIHFEG